MAEAFEERPEHPHSFRAQSQRKGSERERVRDGGMEGGKGPGRPLGQPLTPALDDRL